MSDYEEARGLIYDAKRQPANKQVASFTSLLKLDSGTLLSSFQVATIKHGPDSSIGICRSTDGGQTWETLDLNFETSWNNTPGSLTTAELVETEPGRLLLITSWFDRSQPERPLLDPVTEGVLRTRQLKAFSSDEGRTWTPWEEVFMAGVTGCAATGQILRWSDGLIAYPFESFKEYDDPRPIGHGAWLLPSYDGGETFRDPVLIVRIHEQEKIYYWDQRLFACREPGRFVGLFWTYDRVHNKQLAVHACQGKLTGNRVTDLSIWSTGITGQISAPLILDDGRWLALVVDRNGPNTMKLWVSHDDGATWPEAEATTVYNHEELAPISKSFENIEYQQVWADMSKWSLGHPSICDVGNGRVLLSFYGGTPDCMHVHWIRMDMNAAATERRQAVHVNA